jgi:hypothetical protein
LGEHNYALAAAANLLDRVRTGATDLRSGLEEMRALRDLLPPGQESSRLALENLDSVERTMMSLALQDLQGHATSSGRHADAAKIKDFNLQLKDAMNCLRLSPNEREARVAMATLKDLQMRALEDDSLYAGIPVDEAIRLRKDLSATLQTLLGAARDKLDLLSDESLRTAGQVALSNALFQAAESASGEEFDPKVFRDHLGQALEAAAGKPERPGAAAVPSGFARELEALSADPLTAKDAIDLVFDIRYRLAGADHKGLVDRAGALKETAIAATDSQFTRTSIKPPDFTLRPPQLEPGPFADRLVEAGRKLVANPADQQAKDDIHRISQSMGLLNLEPLSVDQGIVDICASARQTVAGGVAAAPSTDTLADQAMGMRQTLDQLGDGPDKTLLQEALTALDAFRGEVAESVSDEIDRHVETADGLLAGSPTPETIQAHIETLNADLARALGDPRTGDTLGEVLSGKVQTAVDALTLKHLDTQLARLATSRAGTPTMSELVVTTGENEAGKQRLADFSKARLGELTKDMSSLRLPEEPGEHAGRTVSAALNRLETRIERMLLLTDAAEARSELARCREALTEELGEAAFARVKPEITAALNETERTNLKATLGAAFGSGGLVDLINAGSGENPATAKALASLAGKPAAEIGSKVDELLLGRPDLDGVALDIKLALAPEGDHEDLKAGHVDARLKRQSLDLIRRGGGQDLLDALGVAKPGDLSFKHLSALIADSLTDGHESSPTVLASSFNSLLVQTAWSAYQRENGLKGTPEDLANFTKQLPPPLSTAAPEVIKGMFELGPVSGRLLRRVADFAASGRETIARGDVGRLMDRMADHNPALKARRAMTTMLRNMLASASIEYDPSADSAGAYSKALRDGLARRAEHQPLTGQAADVVKRAIGAITEASELPLPGQLDAAVRTVEGLSGSLDQITRLERDVALAVKELESVHEEVLPTDEELQTLRFKPGEKSSEDPEIRHKQLADPWRFMVHQGALDPATGTVDGSKVRGERIALGILGFRDVLKGSVEGLTTRQEKLAALKTLDVPRHIKFKSMRSVFFESSLDPDSQRFSNALDSLRKLDPKSPNFERDFDNYSEMILDQIDEFGLDRKSELILIHKDSASAVRHRESTGATITTMGSDVVTYGDSVAGRTMGAMVDVVVGGSSAVKSSEALGRGLDKVLPDRGKSPQADALRGHFMTGEYLGKRGQAANLLEAERRNTFFARRQLEEKQTLLRTGLADFSSRSKSLLREATRMSVLEAVSQLGYTSFADAEESVLSGSRDTRLRKAVEDNLQKNFGIEASLARVLVEAEVVKPIQLGRLQSEPVEEGGTLERFCQEAAPSRTVRGLDRRVQSQLAEPVKQLVLAETQRRRFDSLLGQLEPGSAMDFTSRLQVGVQAGALVGPVKATATMEAARESGFALGMTDAGVYQVSLKVGAEVGAGVAAAFEVIEVGVEAGIGVSAKVDECLTLDFKSREDAAEFLGKLADKTLAPEDVHRHCSNVQISQTAGAGVALHATVDAGQVPIMDGGSMGVAAAFSAGFEASGHLERKVERDVQAQTYSNTTAIRGKVGISLTVGIAQTGEEEPESVDLEEDLGTASAALEGAQATGLEVGDETRAVIGKGVVIDASATLEGGELSCELSVTGNKSNTITRSAKSDSRDRLEGAAQNVALDFTGTYAQTQFGKYARDNLGVAPAVVESMIRDIGANGTTFTLEATRTLKPEALERCRQLEMSPSKETNSQVKAILGDDSNYELDSVKLVFGGRSEAEQSDHSLHMGFAKLSAQRKAEGEETTTVEYKAENGPLRRLN